ncbi:MAG TPA: hypothetical protein VJP77_01745, partial [Planctomycetota bacterium]|nr:hypothetical protein [Planctomycetota bacterium]
MRFALTLALLAAPAAAQTFTVAPSGGDFTEIQAAIDAAPPGATVLVAAGQYVPFVLRKPLTILGEGSGVVQVGDWFAGAFGGSLVEQIPAGASARLSGLRFETRQCFPPFDPCTVDDQPTLRVERSAGVVLLHDLVVEWSELAVLVPESSGNAALRVVDASLVLVDRSQLGSDHALPAATGLVATDSTVWVADSALHGGDGLNYAPFAFAYFEGSDAAQLAASVLYAARSQFRGGGSTFYSWGGGTQAWASGGAGIAAEGSVLKLAGGPGSVLSGALGTPVFPPVGIETFDLSLAGGSFALVGEGWSGPLNVQSDPSSHADQVAEAYPTLRFADASVAPGGATALELAGVPGSVVLPFAAFGVAAP